MFASFINQQKKKQKYTLVLSAVIPASNSLCLVNFENSSPCSWRVMAQMESKYLLPGRNLTRLVFNLTLALNLTSLQGCVVSQGMKYIHRSPLRVHGRLKSSNCLVDNLWSLRLSDYGLGQYRLATTAITDNERFTGRSVGPRRIFTAAAVT